jgi:prepilin-type N-terminal cleavage/methylation domain-containing protein
MKHSERKATRNPERSPAAASAKAGGTRNTGFTLVELLVAMFITVVLGTIVVMAYNTSMQSYYRTEKQLQALAAFRNTTDRLEREVNSIVCKSAVYPHPIIVRQSYSGYWNVVMWDTRVKYLHGDAWVSSDPYPWNIGRGGAAVHNGSARPTLAAGDWWRVDPGGRSIYQINFRPRYMGYYSSLDGFTIDRTEWYYNPPEERLVWANGLDDDGDDPDGEVGMRILYDDQGCLMFRKKFDKDMVWREWDTAAGSPNDYRDAYHGPYSRADFPPGDGDGDGNVDELVGPLTTVELLANGDIGDTSRGELESKGYIIDTGTVIGEGFSDLRFYYLYKHPDAEQFVYADWWPWDNDNDPTNTNQKDPNMVKKTISCRIGGSWAYNRNSGWNPNPDPAQTKDFDISYFSLPLAISAKFTFKVGKHRHVYEKLIYLHSSRWLKYLNP